MCLKLCTKQPQKFSLFFFFLSCYSSSLDLESTVATPNEFFSFKKSNNSIKNNSFSLIDSNVSHNQNTKHKTKSISYYNSKVESEQENKEKKKVKPIWPSLAVGRRTRRCCLVNADLPLSLSCVLSPSLFYFLWCDKRVSARLFQLLEAETPVLKPKKYYVRLVRISKLLFVKSCVFICEGKAQMESSK